MPPKQGLRGLFNHPNRSKSSLTSPPITTESPKIPLSSVETHLNISSFSPIPDPASPESQNTTNISNTPTTNGVRKLSYPMQARAGSKSDSLLHSDALLTRRILGTMSPTEAPNMESVPWSSAVGHASTGKSGRVIERLQGQIDQLNRERKLEKVRAEETEKAKEVLSSRIGHLEDRISNYEQSVEASSRQLKRKERMIEELREELSKEKTKTHTAEAQTQAAILSEGQLKDSANRANAIAAQRTQEYEALSHIRTRDNQKHQADVDKMRQSFQTLLRQREEDQESTKKLEVIAEQQRHTIAKLQENNRRLDTNFNSYKAEIDKAISSLRDMFGYNEEASATALDDAKKVIGQMRWVMNVQRDVVREG
ncbi:MAG: hypothetical protein Q9227_006188 [Pyrenula ochraceoflavens]